MPLHQLAAVQECQRVERRKQHLTGFIRRQSAMREHLREILIGELHDDEQEVPLAELATSRVVQSHQAGMGEAGSRTPMRQLSLGQTRNRGHQLDRDLGESFRGGLGQKNPAVVGGPEAAQQRIGAIDDMPFPLGPEVAHRQSLAIAHIPRASHQAYDIDASRVAIRSHLSGMLLAASLKQRLP